jgi:hypothetical protein
MELLSTSFKPGPSTFSDVYLSPFQPSFQITFSVLQREIRSPQVHIDGSISLQFHIISTLLRSFPLQPLHSAFSVIYRSRHIYLNSFLHCLCRIQKIFAIPPTSCFLGGFFSALIENSVPISSDSFSIEFSYSSVQEFTSQFIKIFIPKKFQTSFQIQLKDRFGKSFVRFCLKPEEKEFLGTANGRLPDILLIETVEKTPKSITVVKTEYRLFAVLVSDENNQISAFIGHETDDRWTQIQDTMIREISEPDFENYERFQILSIYLTSNDLSWKTAHRHRELSLSAPILRTDISIGLIIPGDVADGIIRGILRPSIQSIHEIGIDSNSTFAQLYNRVKDWIQVHDRVIRLWRFQENQVIERIPISDEIISDPLPPMLVTFGYPDEIETDFFLYIAIFEPLQLRPPLQLLYTLCVKPDVTFLELIQNFDNRVCQIDNFCATVYVARGIHDIEMVHDLTIPIESFNVSCGTVIIVEPIPNCQIPKYILPNCPYDCKTDYLVNFYCVEDLNPSCERYFAQRRTSISLRVNFGSKNEILTFPPELTFAQFRSFSAWVFRDVLHTRLDTILFYVPRYPEAFNPPLDVPIGRALVNVDVLNLVIFPQVASNALPDVVRLDIQIEKHAESFFQIFQGGMNVRTLIQRAKERDWIHDVQLWALVQLSPDGKSFEEVAHNDIELRMLRNPVRFVKLVTSNVLINQGEFLMVIKWKNKGAIIFKICPQETLKETRVRLGRIHEGSKVDFLVNEEVVDDDDIILSDLVVNQKVKLEIVDHN